MLLAPHAPGIEAYSNDSPYQGAPAAPNQAKHREPGSASRAVRWNGTLMLEVHDREECFAIGPDGCVWNLARTVKKTDSGYGGDLLPTGLKASSFSAGTNAQDRIVVFAAHGLELSAVVQTSNASATHKPWDIKRSNKFSAPIALQLPELPAGSAIVRVLCEGLDEQLHVGVLVYCPAQTAIKLFAARWQAHKTVRLTELQAGENWRDALNTFARMATY